MTEEEIEKITDAWRKQGEPEIQEELLEAVESADDDADRGDFDPDHDELLPEAISTVVQLGQRVHLDAPAPPARRLHPRRPPDRHAGAPRGDLRATRARRPARC